MSNINYESFLLDCRKGVLLINLIKNDLKDMLRVLKYSTDETSETLVAITYNFEACNYYSNSNFLTKECKSELAEKWFITLSKNNIELPNKSEHIDYGNIILYSIGPEIQWAVKPRYDTNEVRSYIIPVGALIKEMDND